MRFLQAVCPSWHQTNRVSQSTEEIDVRLQFKHFSYLGSFLLVITDVERPQPAGKATTGFRLLISCSDC